MAGALKTNRFTEDDLNIFYTIEYEPESNLRRKRKRLSATCKVENKVGHGLIKCNLTIDGESVLKNFNLWRHIKRKHSKEYEELAKRKEKNIEEKKRTNELTKRKSSEKDGERKSLVKVKKSQMTLDSSMKASKIKITMNKEVFHKGLVEMICLHAVPLYIFDQKGMGFNRITAEMAQNLGVSMNQDAIHHLVISTAEKERQKLRNTLKEKLLYLKMDGGTRGNRNFLAVNVHYYDLKEDRAIVKTLGILDSNGLHSSPAIKEQVRCMLEKFSIDESQILDICVDNAANMTCAVKTFSESESFNSNKDLLSNEYEEESLQVIEQECLEDNLAAEWFENPHLILPDWLVNDESKIKLMRCSIHTLQLAISDGLKKNHANMFITKLQQIATKLGTPNIQCVLVGKYRLMQSLNTVTRWSSTFDMVDRLLKFKDYCEQFTAAGVTDLNLSPIEWRETEHLRELLARAKQAIVTLQAESITPGMFMKEWKKLQTFLQKNGGQIADEIAQSMANREKILFDNTHFLAGIYVDPRYRILLSPSQLEKAKEGLFDICRRLEKLRLSKELVENEHAINETDQFDEMKFAGLYSGVGLHSETSSNQSVQRQIEREQIPASNSDNSLSEEDEFEKELDQRERRQRASSTHIIEEVIFQRNFEEDCAMIEKIGRLKVKSVFESIHNYPTHIQNACRVASCIPTNQASMERLFSALKIIMSDLRNRMKEDLVSAILFYRMNHEKIDNE